MIICDETDVFCVNFGKRKRNADMMRPRGYKFLNLHREMLYKECMKVRNYFIALSCAVLTGACISDEPLAIECDIESIEVKIDGAGDVFQTGVGESTGDGWKLDLTSTIQDEQINFVLKQDVDIAKRIGRRPTHIRAFKGASVYLVDPDNANVMTPFVKNSAGEHVMEIDYSNAVEKPVEIHVHSESFNMTEKHWERIYYITFQHAAGDVAATRFAMNYTFDGNFDLDKSRSYYEWTETDPLLQPLFQTGKPVWQNGNPGYKLSKSAAPADDYPTTVAKGVGPDGSDCIKLETKSTGSFGAMVNMPTAAGSLFNGLFDVSNALKDALLATRFGVPFRYLPVKLEADLRMEGMASVADAGGTFMDEPDLYCVLYDNCGGTYTLNGNDVLSSDKIVAIARLAHHYDEAVPRKDKTTMSPIHGVTGEWKHFELYLDYNPFDRTKEKADTLTDAVMAERIDMGKLSDYGYSIVIGASSSWQGAHFRANVGSKLYLDNIKLTCNNPLGSGEDGGEVPEPTEFDGTAVMDFNYEPTLVERVYSGKDVKYYDWTETDKNLTLSLFSQYGTWASTNENFMVYRNGAQLHEYPVQPAQEGGAVVLTTVANGFTGTIAGHHRTPGMIYTGILNLNDENAESFVQAPFQEMKLGVPFAWKPTELEATVKYKAGAEYREGGTKVDKQDKPEIFCVVYRNTDAEGKPYELTMEYLNDALNSTEESVLQELQVVGRAKMPHPVNLSATEFTDITLPVYYLQEVSEEDFASGEYSVVVGAMSSYRAMLKEGAENSCLTVDRIVLKTTK